MSKVNHTPGPWTFREELPSGPHDSRAEIFAHGDVIGIAYGDSRVNNSQSNARLFAAAPLLKDACWAALVALGKLGANGDMKHPLREEWVLLQRAYNKATQP